MEALHAEPEFGRLYRDVRDNFLYGYLGKKWNGNHRVIKFGNVPKDKQLIDKMYLGAEIALREGKTAIQCGNVIQAQECLDYTIRFFKDFGDGMLPETEEDALYQVCCFV